MTTNVNTSNILKMFDNAIKSAKLEYISDISWVYLFEDENITVNFYQDETGKNIIEQFLFNRKGLWVSITPTDKQIKQMFEILNNTPYREVEPELTDSFWEACNGDNYEYNGVKRENFY